MPTVIRRNSSKCVNPDKLGCGGGADQVDFMLSRSEGVPLGVEASESCFAAYCCSESV